MPTTGVPGWLIFAGSTLVALVFSTGTMALLILGRSVPETLWILDGVVGTAYFGAGPFSVVHNATTSTTRALIDTLNHQIATLRDAVTAMTHTVSIPSSGTTTVTTGTDAKA